jgi:adenylate kinase
VVQRDDDKEEAIRKRLALYRKTTEPLKGFYDERNKFVEVDGTGSAEAVNERLMAVLKERD